MRYLISALLVLAGACANRTDPAAERRAILAADSAWLAAAQARNVEATLAFWTPDARVIGAGQAAVIGEQAIRKMVMDGFATPGFSVSWHTTDVVVGPAGDLAYSLGTNQFTVPTGSGGIDTLRGQAVVVWRKLPNGTWRAAIDTWTPAPNPVAQTQY